MSVTVYDIFITLTKFEKYFAIKHGTPVLLHNGDAMVTDI